MKGLKILVRFKVSSSGLLSYFHAALLELFSRTTWAWIIAIYFRLSFFRGSFFLWIRYLFEVTDVLSGKMLQRAFHEFAVALLFFRQIENPIHIILTY